MSIYSSPFFVLNTMFTEEESKFLSKQRIIQKNLVHFQGFPDRLYNKELLISKEYFGQYGNICKIILTNKVEKKANKKSNSAYITFATFEQAAYAILSVDSIKIDNMLVRAFFGTTKYCNHFLNNFNCFNSEKCMFLHSIADKSDIIADNSKFGYSEHIKLAKKIIGFGSIQSQLYVMNNANKSASVLPSILTIYHKDDVLVKTKNHRRKRTNGSENSTNSKNSSNNKSNIDNVESNICTRSSSNCSNRNSSTEKKEIKKTLIMNVMEKNYRDDNSNNMLFKSRNHSRFDFANLNITDNKNNDNDKDKIKLLDDNYNKNNDNKNILIQELIDELTFRLAFFIQFNKNIPLKEIESEYCSKLCCKHKNDDILRLLVDNPF